MTNENGHDSHADAATGQDQHLGTLSSFVEVPVHRKKKLFAKYLEGNVQRYYQYY